MSRQYDLVLLGATGFTGKLTAEYIHEHLPHDLKWAIAGRSRDKLLAIIDDLKKRNGNRTPPSIEIASLSKGELTAVSSKGRVLINTIGPYNRYSTPVVEACVETGTHYLDVTGEAPWVSGLVKKYHEAARKTGTIVIPQCGVESSPADVLTYVLASNLRKRTGLAVREVTISLTQFEGTPSGGTIASALGLFEDYGPGVLKSSSAPQAHFPPSIKLPSSPPSAAGLLPRLTGLRNLQDIGLVGLPMLNSVDIPIVQRTWALLHESKQPEDYGPNFRFSTGAGASSYFSGLLINLAAIVGPMLLALPPIRWLLKFIITEPGLGPSKEVEAKGIIEQKGVAFAEEDGKGRVTGALRWKGGMYGLTAVVVSEAARQLLYNEGSTLAKQLGGGLCTPATLGDKYVESLRDAGVKIDVSFVEK